MYKLRDRKFRNRFRDNEFRDNKRCNRKFRNRNIVWLCCDIWNCIHKTHILFFFITWSRFIETNRKLLFFIIWSRITFNETRRKLFFFIFWNFFDDLHCNWRNKRRKWWKRCSRTNARICDWIDCINFEIDINVEIKSKKCKKIVNVILFQCFRILDML